MIGKLFVPPAINFRGSAGARISSLAQGLRSPSVVGGCIRSIGNQPGHARPQPTLPRPVQPPADASARSPRNLHPDFPSVHQLTREIDAQLRRFDNAGKRLPTGAVAIGRDAPARPLPPPKPANLATLLARQQEAAMHRERSTHSVARQPANGTGHPSPPPSPPPMPGTPGSAPSSPGSASLQAASVDWPAEPLRMSRTVRPPVVAPQAQAVMAELRGALERRSSGSATRDAAPSAAPVGERRRPAVLAAAPVESSRFNGKLFERVTKIDANKYVRELTKSWAGLAGASQA